MNLNPWNSWSHFFGQCIGTMIVLVPFMFWHQWVGRQEVQKHAIEAGVAEYYLDAEHDRQFRFITNNCP